MRISLTGATIGGLALNLPAEIRGWRAATVPSDGYRPVFQNPDLEHERFYRYAEKGQVYLYIAAYAFQKQGKEAVFYANRVYDDKAWQPVVTRTQRLGNGATVQETRIQSSTGAEKLVWQWYYVHGFMVSSDYMAKLLNAWGTLNRDPAIAVVVVAADLEGGDEDTVALLTRFVADTRQTVEGAIDSGQRR